MTRLHFMPLSEGGKTVKGVSVLKIAFRVITISEKAKINESLYLVKL